MKKIGTIIQSDNQLTVVDYYGNVLKSIPFQDFVLAFDDDHILISKRKNNFENENRIQLLDCLLNVFQLVGSDDDEYCNELLKNNFRLFMVYDRPFSLADYHNLLSSWPIMSYEIKSEQIAKFAHSLFFQFLEFQRKKQVKIIYSDRFMFHYIAVFKEVICDEALNSNKDSIFNRLESVFEKIIN
jgi:hypothetical protein